MLNIPQISIQQLSYLVSIAEEPSWAAAASRLHVTPSALSQGVAELERRLGIDLFVREGRRRVPRGEAQPVFDYARSVIVQTADLVQWANTRRAGRSGRLRVGMIDVAAVHHFPETVRAFTAERPDVLFELVVAPSSELMLRLRSGELDLAIVVETPDEVDMVDAVRLLSEPLAVYRPPGPEPSGSPSEWGPFVGFPPSSHTRSLIGAALGRNRRTIRDGGRVASTRCSQTNGSAWNGLDRPAGQPSRKRARTSRTSSKEASPRPESDRRTAIGPTGPSSRRCVPRAASRHCSIWVGPGTATADVDRSFRRRGRRCFR